MLFIMCSNVRMNFNSSISLHRKQITIKANILRSSRTGSWILNSISQNLIICQDLSGAGIFRLNRGLTNIHSSDRTPETNSRRKYKIVYAIFPNINIELLLLLLSLHCNTDWRILVRPGFCCRVWFAAFLSTLNLAPVMQRMQIFAWEFLYICKHSVYGLCIHICSGCCCGSHPHIPTALALRLISKAGLTVCDTMILKHPGHAYKIYLHPLLFIPCGVWT